MLPNQPRSNRAPQAGEIWQVGQTLHSSLQFSTHEQQRLYSEPARRFLAGQGLPRYVMIVTMSDQLSLEEWPAVSVMVLSLELEFLSNVDILIPTVLSGLSQDVLAETWNLQDMLVANLAQPVGHRLSRPVYDQLLNTGDYHHQPGSVLPKLSDLQASDLQASDLQAGDRRTEQDLSIQAFHRRESAWSDVLTVPVAACQAYFKGIQTTEQILQEAIALERELLPPIRTRLSQWFQGYVEIGWETFSEVWPAPLSAIAVRSPESSGDSPANPNEISMLIHRLQVTSDEHQRRRIAEQLGNGAIGDAIAISALINLLQSTQDDATLWTAVESLWRLDPGNLAAGVRQVKLMDLGMQVGGQPITLVVAVVQKVDQTVGVRLQVYPASEAEFLPPNLKLVLLDYTGQVVREVVARQSDIYMQLKFSGASGEEFSVSVELGTTRITEDFII
jgi:hypothetical protein